jgi:hypothetical protein
VELAQRVADRVPRLRAAEHEHANRGIREDVESDLLGAEILRERASDDGYTGHAHQGIAQPLAGEGADRHRSVGIDDGVRAGQRGPRGRGKRLHGRSVHALTADSLEVGNGHALTFRLLGEGDKPLPEALAPIDRHAVERDENGAIPLHCPSTLMRYGVHRLRRGVLVESVEISPATSAVNGAESRTCLLLGRSRIGTAPQT